MAQKPLTTTEEFFKQSAFSSAGNNGLRVEFSEALKQEVLSKHLDYISKEGKSSTLMDKMKNVFASKPAIFASGGLLTVLIVAVLAATGVLNNSSTPNSPDNNPTTATIGAEIAYIEGDVEYRTYDNGWETAASGTNLTEGDMVRVLEEGRAIINLDDGSAIRLDSKAEVALTSMNPNDIRITNMQGVIYTRVAEADRSFTVLADEETYQALGTAYKTVNWDKKKGVEVYQSKVFVGGELTVSEGEKYYPVLVDEKKKERKVLDIALGDIRKDKFVLWNKDQDKPEYGDKLGILEDLEAPDLKITSPESNITTTKSEYTIAGKTEAGAKVTVNDKKIDNDNGKFSYKVSLKLGTNEFVVKSQDAAGNTSVKTVKISREEEKVETPTDPGTSAGIYLTAYKTDTGIKLQWSVSGVDTSKGFKILKGYEAYPSYPNNSLTYISDPNARSYFISVTDGKTYNFRVCNYNGNGCSTYSNNVAVTAPSGSVEGISSISLSGAGTNVSWSYVGTCTKGYKVVWSKTANPVYPGNEYIYISNCSQKNATLNAYDGPGTYYVRVCEYTYSGCQTYSNQITVEL